MSSSEQSGRQPVQAEFTLSELDRLVAALADANGHRVDGRDLDLLVDWVKRARLEYALSLLILEGAVIVTVTDGELKFRRRALSDTPTH
jgi:hypothetical protein